MNLTKDRLFFSLLLLLSFYGSVVFGQCVNGVQRKLKYEKDSIFRSEAIGFLNTKLGNEFVEQYLQFDQIYYTFSVTRNIVPRVVTFIINNPTSQEGKNMIPVYFINSIVDTINSIIEKSQLQECLMRKINCKFLVDRESAINIALKAGANIEKIRSFDFRLINGKPTWLIETINCIGRGYGNGDQIGIDATTGTFNCGEWSYIE